MVDRLVGYTLSPLLAGKAPRRVCPRDWSQSVAVRLVVERERESTCSAPSSTGRSRSSCGPGMARLRCRSRPRGRAKPRSATRPRRWRLLASSEPRRVAVTRRVEPESCSPCSTLQQEASRKLGFAPKRTPAWPSAAQRGGRRRADGAHHVHAGTNWFALSAQAIAEAHDVIVDRYGAVRGPQGPPLQDEKS